MNWSVIVILAFTLRALAWHHIGFPLQRASSRLLPSHPNFRPFRALGACSISRAHDRILCVSRQRVRVLITRLHCLSPCLWNMLRCTCMLTMNHTLALINQALCRIIELHTLIQVEIQLWQLELPVVLIGRLRLSKGCLGTLPCSYSVVDLIMVMVQWETNSI